MRSVLHLLQQEMCKRGSKGRHLLQQRTPSHAHLQLNNGWTNICHLLLKGRVRDAEVTDGPFLVLTQAFAMAALLMRMDARQIIALTRRTRADHTTGGNAYCLSGAAASYHAIVPTVARIWCTSATARLCGAALPGQVRIYTLSVRCQNMGSLRMGWRVSAKT